MSDELMQLPDTTFHRVSVKALIFDDDGRLLLMKNNLNFWELPGGGWDQGETMEQCLARELDEELEGVIGEIGNIEFCYQGKTQKGYPKVSIAVNVGLKDFARKPKEADLLEMKFVTREELESFTQFDEGDEAVLQHVNEIWRS